MQYNLFRNRKSIYFRIAASWLFLILLCTITVSAVICNFAQNLLYKNVVQSNGALLVQIDGNFSNLLEQLNTVINVSDSSLYFRSLLTEPCDDQMSRFEKQMELHRFLSNYYNFFTQYKACMTVVGQNGVSYTTYDGEQLIVNVSDLLEEPWVKPVVEANQYETTASTLSHPGISTVTEGQTVILFARSLVDSYTMKQCGWIFLEIDPTGLEQLYAKSHQAGEYVFITDRDGNVISSNAKDTINHKLENIAAVPSYSSNESAPVSSRTFQDTDCLSIKIPLTSVDGYLIKYIEKRTISRQLNKVIFEIVSMAILFCLTACVLSLFLSQRITKPIIRLSQKMASTRYGKISLGDTQYNCDELSTLETTFTNLLNTIDVYTENMQAESIARREAELNALRMQINPHFLYNTLSCFRYLVESGYDRQKIGDSILSFIRLLRGTISNKSESIPLENELENLDSYITIMNLRYDGRIQMQNYVSDPKLYRLSVPKLILQPIIENSIFHGFPSGGDEPMEISLYISEINRMLRIEVADNGCGIPYDVLAALRSGTYRNNQSMSGVGLNNIDQRLKLMYGPAYGLEIQSTQGMGTIVTVQIPLSQQPEVEDTQVCENSPVF